MKFTTLSSRLALLALFASLIEVAAFGEDLIQNGQFTANASDYAGFPGYGGAPTDWTLTLNGSAAGENGPDVPGTGPFAGSGAVFGPANVALDNQGNAIGDFFFLEYDSSTSPVLSQSFDVVAGMTYNISYDAGVRTSTAGGESANNGLQAEIIDGTDGTGNILFDQTSSLPDDQFYLNSSTGDNSDLPGTPLFTTLTGASSDTFTADTTGQVTLYFSVLSGGDQTADLTNVSVAAVPEPSTLALGLLALPMILFAAFRRRVGLV